MTTKVWPINFQIGQTFVVLVWTTKDKGFSNSLDPRTLVTNWSKSAKRPTCNNRCVVCAGLNFITRTVYEHTYAWEGVEWFTLQNEISNVGKDTCITAQLRLVQILNVSAQGKSHTEFPIFSVLCHFINQAAYPPNFPGFGGIAPCPVWLSH